MLNIIVFDVNDNMLYLEVVKLIIIKNIVYVGYMLVCVNVIDVDEGFNV